MLEHRPPVVEVVSVPIVVGPLVVVAIVVRRLVGIRRVPPAVLVVHQLGVDDRIAIAALVVAAIRQVVDGVLFKARQSPHRAAQEVRILLLGVLPPH